MADIKNDDKLFCVVNRIYDPIISNPKSIITGVKKLFVAKRARVFCQRMNFIYNFILKRSGIFVKILFCTSCDFNVVNIYRPRFAFISKARGLKARVFSCLFRSAIAKSIKSSWMCLFLSSFDKKDSCSVWGKFEKALKKTSTIASAGVMNIHHPSVYKSISGLNRLSRRANTKVSLKAQGKEPII